MLFLVFYLWYCLNVVVLFSDYRFSIWENSFYLSYRYFQFLASDNTLSYALVSTISQRTYKSENCSLFFRYDWLRLAYLRKGPCQVTLALPKLKIALRFFSRYFPIAQLAQKPQNFILRLSVLRVRPYLKYDSDRTHLRTISYQSR